MDKDDCINKLAKIIENNKTICEFDDKIMKDTQKDKANRIKEIETAEKAKALFSAIPEPSYNSLLLIAATMSGEPYINSMYDFSLQSLEAIKTTQFDDYMMIEPSGTGAMFNSLTTSVYEQTPILKSTELDKYFNLPIFSQRKEILSDKLSSINQELQKSFDSICQTAIDTSKTRRDMDLCNGMRVFIDNILKLFTPIKVYDDIKKQFWYKKKDKNDFISRPEMVLYAILGINKYGGNNYAYHEAKELSETCSRLYKIYAGIGHNSVGPPISEEELHLHFTEFISLIEQLLLKRESYFK